MMCNQTLMHTSRQHSMMLLSTLCPKISGPPASDTLNSVCSTWISTKCRTLHYLNTTYGHTHYDVHILPCVIGVSVCLHSAYVQYVVTDKGINQQHTHLKTKSLHRSQKWPLCAQTL